MTDQQLDITQDQLERCTTANRRQRRWEMIENRLTVFERLIGGLANVQQVQVVQCKHSVCEKGQKRNETKEQNDQ